MKGVTMSTALELTHVTLDPGNFYDERMRLTLTFDVLKNVSVMDALWTPFPHARCFLSDETKEKVYALINDVEETKPLPKPLKVITHDPATVVYWGNGYRHDKAGVRLKDKKGRYVRDVTIAMCKGDPYRVAMGVLLCSFRKVTRNRVSIDRYEDVLNELAELGCEDDWRSVLAVINTSANIGMVLSEGLYPISLLNNEERGYIADTLSVAIDVMALLASKGE